MEQNQSSTLFSLSIDPMTKSSLNETAKWARFLAIAGMVALGLMVLAGLFFSTIIASTMNKYQTEAGGFNQPGLSTGFGIGIAIIYIIIALVWFFPLLYLLRFANKMKVALNGNDQQALNISFENLKACFRYVGIITIIVLAIYALFFLIAIIAGAAML